MDWRKSYSAIYILTKVDPVTWKDVEQFKIISGSIDKDCSSALIESATVDMTDTLGDKEYWVRINLKASQNGDEEYVPLFTGLSSVPTRNIEGGRVSYSVECHSVLKPSSDILLQRGWYVPKAFNGAEMVKRLLSVNPCPIYISGESPYLKKAIVAEQGESNLSMALKILDAIDWRLRVTGDGSVEILPEANFAETTFNPIDCDIVEDSITDTIDWYSCPNVLRVISEGMAAVVKDENPNSRLSTVSRGREIWEEENVGNLKKGETLAQYAIRRLKRLQEIARTISYSRRYDPSICVGDAVGLNYPEFGLDGLFISESQSIQLGYSPRVSESIRTKNEDDDDEYENDYE